MIESESRLLARAFLALVSDLVAAKHPQPRRRIHLWRDRDRNDARWRPAQQRRSDRGGSGAGRHWRRTGADGRERAGLPSQGGIAVDACGRTAASGVFCAGDAALQWSRCHGRAIRVETWANAQNQAISVAANMIGEAKEYNDPPWFWTDQYDLNIQVAGDMLDSDHIVRGDERSGKILDCRDARRGRWSVRCRSMPPRKWPCSRRVIAANAKPVARRP